MPSNPDPATEPEVDSELQGEERASRSLGLVLLWCSENMSRVGAFIPFTERTRYILGRGAALARDSGVRAVLIDQRPGENLQLAPIENATLSRTQLELQLTPDGLSVRNVGKLQLKVNDLVVERADVRVGDLLQIGRQLLCMCVERPLVLPGERTQMYALGAADPYGIVGHSESAWRLRRELAFAAARAGHVLILGPTGTGKELVARAVHALSRAPGQWIPRNASTLPETLIDAELFGNPKGYPNPGVPERKGLVGAADGGSLFLDELGDLPIAAQTHLLRVLDHGEYQRLGETTVRHSRFRLIGATNRSEQALRRDVVARFAFRIRTPSLAERRDDIVLLARHLLLGMVQEDASMAERFFTHAGEPRLGLELVTVLARHPLTGNVRELKELLWQAIAQSSGDVLEPPRQSFLAATASPKIARSSQDSAAANDARITAAALRTALERHEGSLQRTWRALGLSSRYALMRLMKKHGVKLRKQADED